MNSNSLSFKDMDFSGSQPYRSPCRPRSSFPLKTVVKQRQKNKTKGDTTKVRAHPRRPRHQRPLRSESGSRMGLRVTFSRRKDITKVLSRTPPQSNLTELSTWVSTRSGVPDSPSITQSGPSVLVFSFRSTVQVELV